MFEYPSNHKLCICYTACGPSYKWSALSRINDLFFNHPNLYYSILTDDKNFFEWQNFDIKNLVIHDIKDYYRDYPYVKTYESFLLNDDGSPIQNTVDYGNKFRELNYKFPFAVYRFHLLQAAKFGVPNVALLSTDIKLKVKNITDKYFESKNSLYAHIGYSDYLTNDARAVDTVNIIKEKYGLDVPESVYLYDEAARLYVFQDVDFMMKFFSMWQDVTTELYLRDQMKTLHGNYVVHDEPVLAIIHHVLGIHPPVLDAGHTLYFCYEVSRTERWWTY